MKYSKWISIGRKEKAKSDIAIVDDLKDGSKLKRKHGGRNLKDSTVEKRSSPTKVSSESVVDATRNLAVESALELSDTKTPQITSPKSKRKSWYSISSKRSEESKPKSIDQSTLYDQAGTLKDRMTTSQSTRHTRDDVSKSSPNNSITIIVTSPTSDAHFKQEDLSPSSSNASSLSRSSLSSTSSFDTTRLMPPSISPSIQKYPKSNEAPEVKKWLIGCMNRKADTLPRKLVYRIMELYNIKEHELDPKMLDKLRAGIEDEGIVLPIDIEPESKDKKNAEPNSTEALRHLRTSLHPHAPAEGKEKRPGKGKSGQSTHAAPTKRTPKTNNPPPPTPPKKPIPGANPRIWQNPSSRVRNWPTTNPNLHPNPNSNSNSALANHPFPFPPYMHPRPRHRPKNTAPLSRNKNIHPTSKYAKRGPCPPRRGSVISLCSIPENGISVGFGAGEGGGR